MSIDDGILERVARDGEMDYNKWPAIIEPLLERLNNIVYNDFPMPKPYANVSRPPEPQSPIQTQSTILSQANTTQSQIPVTPVRNLPPVPAFPVSSATSVSHVPDSLPASQVSTEPLTELPTLLLQTLNSINSTLRSAFSEKPPHTIQRLAELVLHPNKHYKTLPAWLRAVDRVVSVSSSADIFPLSDAPPIINGINGDVGGGILWTNSSDASRNGYDSSGLGSDESLGGALLTPIPWLRNGVSSHDEGEDSNDPDQSSLDSHEGLADALDSNRVTSHGDPLVPERQDGAVTQGELIRMEQEAGVVPVSQEQQSTGRMMAGLDEDDLDFDAGGDTMPHARGPDLVGAIDMGKVDGKDVQVHIGSPPPDESAAAVSNTKTNPSSAQDVLSHHDIKSEAMTGTMSDSDGFEMVGRGDGDGDGDEMQLDIDDMLPSSTASVGDATSKKSEDDEDIVLVDADGKTDEEEGQKAENSGENVGSDAADASTVS